MNHDNVWVVRLGKVRGEGEYVAPGTVVYVSRPACLLTSKRQRDARRITTHWLAAWYAAVFGGRVVRLRTKGGGR